MEEHGEGVNRNSYTNGYSLGIKKKRLRNEERWNYESFLGGVGNLISGVCVGYGMTSLCETDRHGRK